MDYRLELLDSSTYEELINCICTNILGKGVVSFAPGKDGGRDGKFVGTAENYPSKTNPWNGKFIIQAKHTANPIASCADSDFERLILNEEVPKIKKLIATGDIDCYIIFTNRKYSGISGEKLLKKIQTATGLNNVAIIGKETLNNNYINTSKELIRQFGLSKHHIPFDFSDEEIKEIILMFKSQLFTIETELKVKVDNVKYDFDHLEKEEKNKKNKLGKEYYENVILSSSLMDFDKIQHFLDSENNTLFKEYYFDIASELNQIITVQRDNFGSFEEIFVFIYQKVCDGSIDLKGSKRHVLTFLHYIYMECLIGIK
ncbi:ABC-three component system protein [Pedobacter antarcticus]|uniref:ABC-three component system protein n=1 Tax=Pedobacter antarcticus TaxID=34086 RepID=UPI0008903805|nr:ABC-three component system protein [Pedobacter antarcticus]SDL86329.1 hypothetical protein SAMN04488084_102711 [Pedobacter antarcticus]